MLNRKALANELFRVHGILPVAASGKMPLGGSGWNRLPLAERLVFLDAAACTGIGFQFGTVLHPFYGWCEFRGVDVDAKNPTQRDAFGHMLMHLLGNDAIKARWRWGRGPLLPIFIRGGDIKRERFGVNGEVQLLGAGKYAVGWGAHPEVGEYRWPDGDILTMMPPLLDAKLLESMLIASCGHAGIQLDAEKHAFSETPAITEQQLAQLTQDDIARYHAELTAELAAIDKLPSNSGYNRGDKLHKLGLRFGALARSDARIRSIVETAIATLPGTRGQGDVRDFTRGLDESKGLALLRTAEANAQRAEILKSMLPKGAAAPGQELGELLDENIPPLRWLIDRYLPHVGTLALVGKPKIGKSFIILEMGLSICEGGKFWNEVCHPTGVLLYMLEDGKRRVRERVRKLRPDTWRPKRTFRIRYGRDGPFRVNPDGSGGLLDDIRKHKHDFPDIGFVAIDMYKLIRGIAEKGLDAYQSTSQIVAPLSALAQELDIVILIVHHAKKGKIDPDDVSDAASGSNALAGATEGSWTIWRQGEGARIIAEVRESENFDLELVKPEGQLVWQPVESMLNPSRGSVKNQILNVLAAANCELTPGDIAVRLNLEARPVNARLHELRFEGAIQNPRHGIYRIPGAKPRDQGVLEAIMKHGIVSPVTDLVRKLHDPDGKRSWRGDEEATGFAFTEDVISAISVMGFFEPKTALNMLKTHKLVTEKDGVVWFFGGVNQTQQPLPWAAPKAEPQYPWSK